MSLRFFGTDGIRGTYGSESLNDSIAFRAGRAAAIVAKRDLEVTTPKIVVGRDTRSSGESLYRAFEEGVAREGGEVQNLGIAPTPCVSYATSQSDAALGCSITASHNPANDNGIKFFQGDGIKPSESLEQSLDDAIGLTGEDVVKRTERNGAPISNELRDAYAKAILETFPNGLLEGKRVAIDCANGAMYQTAPAVFAALGAEIDAIAIEPNGENINKEVGSECPDSLGGLFESDNYDFGFAFDGDGDRVVLFDESGNRVPGEALLAALAIDAHASGSLVDSTLVTTVQSNLGLEAALKPHCIQVVRTSVGDKHIVRLMKSHGYTVGGEESGHLVLSAFSITGDGLFAALKLAEIITKSEKPASELLAAYSAFPQESKALRVKAKPPLEECANLSSCMGKLESEFGDSGRLLVRYSGTESKIRLLVEARSEDLVASAMTELLEAAALDLQIE